MAYENIENLLKMPWEYEFENEWTTSGFNLKEPIDRFFIFKATDKAHQNGHVRELKETEEFCKNCFLEYGDIVDFDRCKLAIDLYKKLWGLRNRTDYYYFINDTLIGENTLFGGDTMNSVQIPLSKLLEDLCEGKEREKYKKYREQRKYIRYNGTNGYINYTSIMYSLKLYQVNNEEFVNTIRKKFSGFEEYVRAYHTLGNFVLVPGGFNRDRGTKLSLCKNEKIDDFWDLSLEYLYENGFYNFDKKKFNWYINYFFLWDYVEVVDEDYKPKHIGIKKDGRRCFKDFFTTSTEYIYRRGKFMTAMLIIEQNDSNLYKKIQKELFNNNDQQFRGINAVAERIMEENPRIPDAAKKFLEELKENKI